MSVINAFVIPAKYSPTCRAIVFAALLGMPFFLLEYVQNSLPLLPDNKTLEYCGNVGRLMNSTELCPNGFYPASPFLVLEHEILALYPMYSMSITIFSYALPLIAAALIAYSWFNRTKVEPHS
jgi:hypothetical protein